MKVSMELFRDGRLGEIFENCPSCEEELLLESYNQVVIDYILENYDLFTEQYDKRAFELDLSTIGMHEHLNSEAK